MNLRRDKSGRRRVRVFRGICLRQNPARGSRPARAPGADHVIDYTREDFTRNGQRYNLILAVNGFHPITDYLRALSPEGIYIVAGGSMRQLFQAVSLVQCQKDLIFLKELLESGKIVPIIDRCYPLSKTVDAFWYFEKEHAKGKVVIAMNPNGR